MKKIYSYIFIIISCFIISYFVIMYYNNNKKLEKFNNLLNIYDEELQPCGNDNMSNGSWDTSKKCSELDGGVHQICIENIAKNTKNFSKNTGQTDWSENRGDNNHCVCLGAWSLYNTKKLNNKKNDISNKILKCDAIPKNAFSNNYVSKFSNGWNKWNGLEIENQIVNGVESLFDNCYNQNDSKSKKLKQNYCNFAKKNKVLQTNKYNKICKK